MLPSAKNSPVPTNLTGLTLIHSSAFNRADVNLTCLQHLGIRGGTLSTLKNKILNPSSLGRQEFPFQFFLKILVNRGQAASRVSGLQNIEVTVRA